MFKARLGVPMVHVPYRGAAPAATDIMAGRLDFLFTSYISIGEQAKAGKLRIVAIGGKKRIDAQPKCQPSRRRASPASTSRCGMAWWRRRAPPRPT